LWTKRIETELLFKLLTLNSNLALTLGYLNPALNNSAQMFIGSGIYNLFFLVMIYWASIMFCPLFLYFVIPLWSLFVIWPNFLHKKFPKRKNKTKHNRKLISTWSMFPCSVENDYETNESFSFVAVLHKDLIK